MTVREAAEKAYERALAGNVVAVLTEADRRQRQLEIEQRQQQEQWDWARLIMVDDSNPLLGWFPDETWNMTDVPRWPSKSWVVVRPNSEVASGLLPGEQLHFLLHCDGNRVKGVSLTASQRDSGTGYSYWSGEMQDPRFYLKGPADVGRYLRDREQRS